MSRIKIEEDPSLISFECDTEVIFENDFIKLEPLEECCESQEDDVESTKVQSECENGSSESFLELCEENIDKELKANIATSKYPLLVLTKLKLAEIKTKKSKYTNKTESQTQLFDNSNRVPDKKKKLNKIKPYTCDVCNKGFTLLNNLKRHSLIHGGRKQVKPFICDICNKSYTRQEHLNVHKNIHSNVKPYECKVCGKCFNRPSSLLQHKVTHTGDKRFTCDICSKTFNRKVNLKEHITTHTGVKIYKVHKCSLCNGSFSRASLLHYHMLSHTGEKPFSCDVCGKLFIRKDHLNTHRRVGCNIKTSCL